MIPVCSCVGIAILGADKGEIQIALIVIHRAPSGDAANQLNAVRVQLVPGCIRARDSDFFR